MSPYLQLHTCTACLCQYEAKGPRSVYCNECRIIVKKRQAVEYQQRERAKMSISERTAKERKRREDSPKRRHLLRLANARYRKTVKGRAASLRYAAKRANTPIADFSEVLARMHNEQLPCNTCGAEYVVGQPLDHIIPIMLGHALGVQGMNRAWNLQPLCKPCHRTKTNSDISYIAKVKRGEGGLILIEVPHNISTSQIVEELESTVNGVVAHRRTQIGTEGHG